MYNDITARSATLQAGMGVACLILDFVLNSIYLNVYNLDLKLLSLLRHSAIVKRQPVIIA
jgi:hypothetical protein